ncbi:MAG: hypothetical protein NWE89_04500 [Candidatus Bathyarchaeota archaeon]|nr:hypothetical protein [Candidatus Bathyarchaeota archaeon]
MKRRNVVVLIVLVAMALITTTQAWTITTTTQEMSLYEADTIASDRSVTSFHAKPLGKNRVLMVAVISVPSSGTDNVNITMQPLDINGDIIQSISSSAVKENIDSGGWVTWTTYTGVEDIEYYHLHTTTSVTTVKVIIEKTDIALEYESAIIELRDY